MLTCHLKIYVIGPIFRTENLEHLQTLRSLELESFVITNKSMYTCVRIFMNFALVSRISDGIINTLNPLLF